MDPDYGPNPDYGSGLRTKSRLWIRITDQKDVNDGLKIEQDFYAEIFSRNLSRK